MKASKRRGHLKMANLITSLFDLSLKAFQSCRGILSSRCAFLTLFWALCLTPCQEASRVLASGGLLEFLDEGASNSTFYATDVDFLIDIIFPRIPDLERLTSDASSEISMESNGSEASQSSSLNPPQFLPSYEENTEYDEDYLESLYNEVYTERQVIPSVS